jgi:hypothetical protein
VQLLLKTPGFINIFIDQTLFYEHARERMGITTPESLQRSRLSAEDWKKLAYIIFFNEKLLSIAPGQLPAKPINYVFFTPEGESKVTGVMTIRSENYPEALKALRGGNLKTVREYGLFTYQAMLKFIQFY